jgi:hypothetical protein
MEVAIVAISISLAIALSFYYLLYYIASRLITCKECGAMYYDARRTYELIHIDNGHSFKQRNQKDLKWL